MDTYSGTARIYADVFEQHKLDRPPTFIASLSVENSQATISVKRVECETLAEAQAQVDNWANRYGLEFLH